MKHASNAVPSRTRPVLAVTCVLALCAGSLRAADQPAGGPDMQMAMKQMEQLAAPGPEHRILAATAGEWEAEMRCYMPGQDSPMVQKGVSKKSMILGGRVLKEEFKADMMGREFNGVALTTYDRFNKKYSSVWIDDMGPGIFTSEGSADAAGKVLTLTGKMDDPMTGTKGKPTRLVTRVVSTDKHTFEMHDLSLGEGKTKAMEITYTRKGGGPLAGRP